MEVPNERTHGGVFGGHASEEKESNEAENRFGEKCGQRRRVETEELLIIFKNSVY